MPRIARTLAFTVLLLPASRAALPAAEFHVAPTGSDANPGTPAQPFASLERARDAVRALERRGGATVFVHGGVYELTKPLQLDAADSGTAEAPVVWRTYRDEQPILAGSGKITGFVPHDEHIWKANVRALGFTNEFRQLFFDGRRQELARYPNFDPAHPFTSGWTFTDKEPLKTDALKRTLRFSAADARPWARPTDGEVSIFPSHEWWNNILPLAAVDRESRLLTLRRDCSYDIAPGDRYFVRGLREELDAPGEWYLDRDQGTLYFWPPGPLAGHTVAVPRLKSILELGAGAAHISFRGFTLEHCEGTAVVLKNARQCLIAGCTIRHVGDYSGSGVSVSGGAGNGVVGCDISDIGSHGISLGGGDEKTLTPAGNYAENNHITRTGVFHKQGCGINVSGTGNRVARNTLHHLPRFGVMATGQNHVIELNHIHHVSLETMDTAAIYVMSLNWLWGHGTVIRHNFIHDVIGSQRQSRQMARAVFRLGHLSRLDRHGRHGHRQHRRAHAAIRHSSPRRARQPHREQHPHRVRHRPARTRRDQPDRVQRLGDHHRLLDAGDRELEPAIRLGGELARVAQRCQPARPAHGGVARRAHDAAQRRSPEHSLLARSATAAVPVPQRLLRTQPLRLQPCLARRPAAQDRPVPTQVRHRPERRAAQRRLRARRPGKMPDRWSWHIRPSTNDLAAYCDDAPHGGRGCLRITGKSDPANKDKESWRASRA